MRQCLLFFITACTIAALNVADVRPAVAREPGSVGIVPHRAIYSLKLAGAEFGSGIADAGGTMAFEWTESCDTWVIQQKAVFDVFGPEGDAIRTEVMFTSWESKTGDKMGFSLRTLQDGELIEDLRGSASLDRDLGGEAGYTRPSARTVELPPGTIFSAGHTILLIRKAHSGERYVLAPVFLGQRDDEPMTVNGIISDVPPRKRPEAVDGAESNKLLEGPAWRVHLAFYGEEDAVAPAFEVHETLHANGIVEAATVIYDTFSFSYELERLERLSSPAC